MTRAEWAEVMQRYAANWPRHPLPDASAAKFYGDLAGYDQATVIAAIEALFRAGREFPPTSAHILAEMAVQTVDAPPFREAWDLLLRGIQAYGSRNTDRVLSYVAERSPMVAEWAARTNLREIGDSNEGDTTVYAQHRAHYENVVQRAQRALTHGGLPTAVVSQLRPGSGPRPAGEAIGQLAASLAPEEAA